MGFQVGERAFEEAIAAIEKASLVEVVVTVRPRLPRTWAGHAIAGALLALVTLAFVLYVEDWEFDEWSLLVVPTGAGVVGAVLAELLPITDRLLVCDDALLAAARAAFVELGVHRTRARTGLLVYVGVRERRVVVVADVAIVDKLPGLDQLADALTAAFPGGGANLAAVLAKWAANFASAFPHAIDDINELPDAVDTRMMRPRTARVS
jgi:putative membrane protein